MPKLSNLKQPPVPKVSAPSKVSMGKTSVASVKSPSVAPLKSSPPPKAAAPQKGPKPSKPPKFQNPNRAMYAQDLPKPPKG